MEPILSKQEIADLLSTLQEREPATESNFVSPGIPDTSVHHDIDIFHLYQDRIEPDRVPNFDIIAELFCEDYAARLSRCLQCSVDIMSISVDYQQFKTYLISEPNPGAIGVIKADPLQYGGLITFSPVLSFSLLELMLGGFPQAGSDHPDRAATKIELSILESLLVRGCEALQQALNPVVQIKAGLLKTTHDRRLVSLVNPDAELVICTFQIRTEQITESMQLVFPTQTFAPYQEPFENLLHLDNPDANNWFDPVSTTIESMPCNVTAQADIIDMTIKDLIALESGDVLLLNRHPAERLDLLVEGNIKFSGYQEIHNRKRYIHITGSTE